jgi:hypothetical protein
MNAPMLRVPASITDDSSDVAVALEVAAALWEKGDSQEAIRWLKRAVDAARQEGDTPRAETLAQALSDLETSLAAPGIAAVASDPPMPAGPLAPTEATPADAEFAAPTDEFVPPAEPLAAAESVVGLEPAPASAPTPAMGWDGGTRVSVKISARDPTLFILRPLPEGQPLPAGTREGFLVLADVGSSNGPLRAPSGTETGSTRKPNGSGP